jgi:hypothetical protein
MPAENPFQFVALTPEPFAPLFSLSDAELRARSIRRTVVDETPGFPCRVSLADAEVGETVVLLPYTHHDVDTPYRASGPIYVREGVTAARPAPGEVPAMFRHRLLSVRAYDSSAMLVAAEVVPGADLEAALHRLFIPESVAYLHIHNALPGCYNCRVDRAQ